LATIRQVAKKADVSIATVSRVLNNTSSVSDEIKMKVHAVINQLGYVSSVGRRPTSNIGLVYTGPTSPGSPYDAALFEGINKAMVDANYDLVVLNLQRDKKPNESYTQFFLRKAIRGVVLRTTSRTRHICTAIAGEGFPSIVVGDHFDEPNVNYLYGDSRQTSYQAIEHLITLGHRRITIAISAIEDSDHTDRLEGYKQALAEHDIEIDPKLIHRIPAQRPDGAQVIRKLMGMAAPPTAVFVTDPNVAVGTINQAHRMGIRIPEDLSILGFDDTDVRNNTYPQMTAICQDAQQLGYEAFMAIVQKLSGSNSHQVRRTLPTWLEFHDTTGKPPVSLSASYLMVTE